MNFLIFFSAAFAGAMGTRLMVEPPGFEGNGNPITSRDRIYTGDQSSNTITVIDPSVNKVLGTINLGDERLGSDLGPQYVESVNSHGLGFSRDGKYIVSLSITTNTINVFRTADNTLVSRTSVDRAPHEAFFAPDNRTIWIGTRGTDTVDLIDGLNGTFLDRIPTAAGPSKVLFNGNGTTAYVNHIFAPVLTVIDVASRKVLYNITGLPSAFSSDMAITPDSRSLWAAHKLTGQVSVIDLSARRVATVLDTGTETNHPNFALVNGSYFGFVTVAAINATRVYRLPEDPSEVPVLVKTIRNSGIQPHGLWPSPDSTRMYVVNQHSDTVDAIDTHSLTIIETFGVGQDSQSLIYVSDVTPEGSNGTENLGTQGLGLRVENLLLRVNSSHPLEPPVLPSPYGNEPQALITVRETAGLDMFQVIGRDLVPNATYTVSARCKGCGEEVRLPIVDFNASQETNGMMGCGGNEQVLAFLRFFDGFELESVRVDEMK